MKMMMKMTKMEMKKKIKIMKMMMNMKMIKKPMNHLLKLIFGEDKYGETEKSG